MKRILVIDDSEADQFFNEVTITDELPSVEIFKAYDGVEGLQILEEEEAEFDLILLDINMPRMNGHDFLREYTSRSDKEIPVIVMLTSSDQTRDREAADAYRCVKDYMVKPITPEKINALKALVESVL